MSFPSVGDAPEARPYNGRNLVKSLVDWAVPITIFLLYFKFYNFGKFSPSEMVKTSGLVSISLLAITLLIGPSSHFVHWFNTLKVHRKFWGIASFLVAVLHLVLVSHFYLKWNLFKLVDIGSPRFLGYFTGLLSLAIMLIIFSESNKKAMSWINPKVWSAIQATSYLALVLALLHFFYVEQVNGILVIKRLFGKITFWFVFSVVLVRLMLFVWLAARKILKKSSQ